MSLLEAFPREEGKKGADKGIDGVVYFIDGPKRTPHKAVVQVKSGKVSSRDIRDLKGTVEREQAALGLFITLEEPTRDMRTEAVSAGFYHSDIWQRDYPKLQLRTIAELLAGTEFEVPRHASMYQAAQPVQRTQGRQAAFDQAIRPGRVAPRPPHATPVATPQPSPHKAVAQRPAFPHLPHRHSREGGNPPGGAERQRIPHPGPLCHPPLVKTAYTFYSYSTSAAR